MYNHLLFHLKEAISALLNMDDSKLEVQGYYINPLLTQKEPAAFLLFRYDVPAVEFKRRFMMLFHKAWDGTKSDWTCYTKQGCTFARSADAILGFGKLDLVLMHVEVESQEVLSPGPIPVKIELVLEWDGPGPSDPTPLPWRSCQLPSHYEHNYAILSDRELDEMAQARWHAVDRSIYAPQD